eukprot:gene17445-14942_t
MLRHQGGLLDTVVSVAASLAGLALPLAMLRQGGISQVQAAYKLDPSAEKRRWCQRMWLGPGEWLSLERSRVERWGVAFRAALPNKHAILACDVVGTQVALISAAVGGGSCAACGVARLIDAAIALCFVVLLLRRRPYARPLRLPLTVAAQLFLLIGCLALAIGYFTDCPQRPPAHSGLASAMLTASGVAMLVALFVDGLSALRG